MEPNRIHIQHELNKIQHRHGFLPESELKALVAREDAKGVRIPLHRLHEVASFFPHYRLTQHEGIEVKVCRDMSCHLMGSAECKDRLERLVKSIASPRITVDGVSCLGQCDGAPAIVIDDHIFFGKLNEEYEALVLAVAKSGVIPPSQRSSSPPPRWEIDCYRDETSDDLRYSAVRAFLASPADGLGLINSLEVANLRGMGGAGQAASEKWRDVVSAGQREGIEEKYVVCNADESEPGTFKDRELLLHTPHLVIEGVILAGLVTKAKKGYIYIRHEYQDQISAVEREIMNAVRLGACGSNIFGSGRSFPVEVYISPGGYICGEQSALIEAMEDKRAEPRNKPPELATNGLWDKPTLLSNVETFAWVPAIARRGGEWYRDQGVNGSKGMRFFSISGHVESPGVYEVPIGLTLGELIARAGGITGGKSLKAVAASGPSGGFAPAQIPIPKGVNPTQAMVDANRGSPPTHRDLLSMELDIDVFRAYGVMLGGGLVVYAEGVDMVSQALCCTSFFRNESCGKCVPCRQGSQQLVVLGTEIATGDVSITRMSEIQNWVDELRFTLQQTSICGLGVVAAEPLATTFQFFREDLDLYARVADRNGSQEQPR